MLENIFAFDGRLTRLEFLGWSALFVVGAMVVGLILMIGCVIVARPLSGGVGNLMAILWIPWLLLAGADLWGGCGLQTRRIRDIGWSPLYVVGSLTAFRYIDLFLENGLGPQIVSPVGKPAPVHHPGVTLVCAGVTLAYTLVLLFWPGRGPGPELGRVAADTIPTPRSQSSRPAPSERAPGMPRTEFGLRGRH